MLYTIADVAQELGMTTEGLRYYEKQGILQAEKNDENGYRVYQVMEVPLLRMVKMLCSYGFSLVEAGALVRGEDSSLPRLLELMLEKKEELRLRAWRDNRLLDRLEEQITGLEHIVSAPGRIWFEQGRGMYHLEYVNGVNLRKNRELRDVAEHWFREMPIVYPMPILHREDIHKTDFFCPAGLSVYQEDMEMLKLPVNGAVRHIPARRYLCGLSQQKDRTQIDTRASLRPILQVMEEMNLELDGDVLFQSIAASREEERTKIHYQVWVPARPRNREKPQAALCQE